MKKLTAISIVLFTILLSASSCVYPTDITEVPTTIPTATEVPIPTTEVLIPTTVPTINPTDIPPEEATPTLLATVPTDATNLFKNPGFEGEVRNVILPEINVFVDWQPFYCDTPYIPGDMENPEDKCPAERQGEGNPMDLKMRRPEFKPSDVPNRVHGGNTAQQWFCFFGACKAGVYQTIDTVPGAVCDIEAYVQSWSGNGTSFTSELVTQDDQDNSTWVIHVNLSGNTFAWSESNLTSKSFGYEDNIYDQYTKITYSFTANSDKATIFFENLRLWPMTNNDNYIDDVSVKCSE